MRPRIYRLMIENAVIKLKDRNGSAEGEIKIATIFIPYMLVVVFFSAFIFAKSNFVLHGAHFLYAKELYLYTFLYLIFLFFFLKFV